MEPWKATLIQRLKERDRLSTAVPRSRVRALVLSSCVRGTLLQASAKLALQYRGFTTYMELFVRRCSNF